MADQGEGLGAEAIGHLEDVRCVVDPSVRSRRGDFAQAASAEVDAHELDASGSRCSARNSKLIRLAESPGIGEHQRRIRRPVASGVQAT